MKCLWLRFKLSEYQLTFYTLDESISIPDSLAIYNLYSKREKELLEKPSDILVYDVLPLTLRTQIIHILKDAFGEVLWNHPDVIDQGYKFIQSTLCREYGVFKLNDSRESYWEVTNFILTEKDISKVLDAVELSFKYIEVKVNEREYASHVKNRIEPENAIEELNDRFKEHGVGYQYESNNIIKVDSTYIHSEVVKPTLALLWNPRFEGANEEFRKAHEHYRHGRNKECLVDCLKAFESVMKVICTKKRWSFNHNDTCKTLINICLTHELIPVYLQTQLSALKSVLESGIPTLRNKLGGHGQGTTITDADDQTTRYALNLTGSTIIYLVELSLMD
jgi:hypothetical protein